MNLSGITGNLTRNADKIGLIAGFVGQLNGVDGVFEVISQATKGNVHLPDIGTMLGGMSQSGHFKTGITAAIAGYVIDEFAPNGFKKYGKVLSDAGIGYVEGTLAAYVVYSMTHGNQGSNPALANFNPGFIANIGNAPTTQQAIAASYQY